MKRRTRAISVFSEAFIQPRKNLDRSPSPNLENTYEVEVSIERPSNNISRKLHRGVPKPSKKLHDFITRAKLSLKKIPFRGLQNYISAPGTAKKACHRRICSQGQKARCLQMYVFTCNKNALLS